MIIAERTQEDGTALFMEKRFAEATERYVAAADSAGAVPEKTEPGGEEEQAAVALEVRLFLSSFKACVCFCCFPLPRMIYQSIEGVAWHTCTYEYVHM